MTAENHERTTSAPDGTATGCDDYMLGCMCPGCVAESAIKPVRRYTGQTSPAVARAAEKALDRAEAFAFIDYEPRCCPTPGACSAAEELARLRSQVETVRGWCLKDVGAPPGTITAAILSLLDDA